MNYFYVGSLTTLLIGVVAAQSPNAPVTGSVVSASVPTVSGPPLKLALEAAQVAIETCANKQQLIGVTVIDANGVLKVALASDGASTRGVTSSGNKAQTALNFKVATSQLGEQAKTDAVLADKLSANANFNTRAGGILIKSGEEILGAIGVGGAHGSDIDEACAVAGLQRIQARLK